MSDALELVVGLEVHCQLSTSSKIFCGCSTTFGSAPNSNTCPVCLGLPGSLPVLNAQAVALATRAALALDCRVHRTSIFARKNYFYPDLPKGYQISQFDRPLATNGVMVVASTSGGHAHIRITRVHMEEDAGKSVHDRYAGYTAVDLNRAGTALIEIVSEPDIRSAGDAGRYLRAMKQLLEYTEVSDANMEEGSLRVDVNISVRPRGSQTLGVKTEIKNLNTFAGVERAIEIEYARQCAVLEGGGTIVQQTMRWDGVRNQVRPARSKEGSHDYRYFPDPDLPPLVLETAFIDAERARLPELPQEKRARIRASYALTEAEAEQVTASATFARYFEELAAASGDARRAVNWLLGAVTSSLNSRAVDVGAYPLSATRLGALIRLEVAGTLSNAAARQLLATFENDPHADPADLAAREGLLKVSDDTALRQWIDDVFDAHPEEARRFIAGERKLQGVIVGLVMKRSGGSADPRKVNQLLSERAE